MQNNEHSKELNESPIYLLLQKLKDGTQDPETLTKDLRQSVVELLIGEGYSVMSIAQILKRSEKTIKRDVEDIRERNALSPDIRLATKMIGELVMYARIHRDHLMKLARMKDASVSEKSLSEYYAFKVETELMTKLQTLGYLPTQPQAVVGEIFHHVDNAQSEASLSELKTMIAEMVNTAKETNTLTPELQQEAEALKLQIEKSELTSQINGFLEKNSKKEESK